MSDIHHPGEVFVAVEAADEPALRAPRARRVLITMGFTVALLVCALSAARWIAALITHRDQGLDPSDESLYLISALRPGGSVARLSNFGYYLHLLQRATGGSASGLRLGGLTILMASTLFAACSLRAWLPTETSKGVQRCYVLSAWMVVSSVALTYYALWIVTPSYNLLTLVFSLLAFGGLISAIPRTIDSARTSERWRPLSGLVTVGCAVVLLTDVKATAGVGIGLLCVSALLITRDRHGTLRTCSALGLGVVIGVLIDVIIAGSPVMTLRYMARYARMTSMSKSYSNAIVWESDFLIHTVAIWMLWFVAAAVIITALWKRVRGVRARMIIISVSALVTAAALWSDRARGGPDGFADNGWWWFRITAWTLLFLTALAPRRNRLLTIGPLVALGALACALGSNNGFIRQSAFTSALFALAVTLQATVIVVSPRVNLARAIPAVVFIVTAGVASYGEVAGALQHPYRLAAPIGANTVPIDLAGAGQLFVTPAMAQYVRDLQAIAPLVPEDARACLVDLSGNTPVSALALNVDNAALPWAYGGFPGSDAGLAYILKFSRCLDGRVLLIDAPHGPNRIALPTELAGRRSRTLGQVKFHGYVDEVQVVSILEPSASP